jgi:hypothetical protein
MRRFRLRVKGFFGRLLPLADHRNSVTGMNALRPLEQSGGFCVFSTQVTPTLRGSESSQSYDSGVLSSSQIISS